MCFICGTEFCVKKCPEAYNSKPVCSCAYCGDTVCKGDEIRTVNNGVYVFHEECMSEMRACEFADFQDIEVQIM